MTKTDIKKVQETLAALAECDEKIADHGPIKVLPRPDSEIPNIPAILARIKDLEQDLRVRRKSAAVAKGHDLDNNGSPIPGRDLKAVGIVEAVETVAKGTDRVLPKATVIVRVRFPDGAHLWFDEEDLVVVEPKKVP